MKERKREAKGCEEGKRKEDRIGVRRKGDKVRRELMVRREENDFLFLSRRTGF